MIVSEKKPFEEILEAIGTKKKIFIIGCGDCATTCKTGGEKELVEISKKLEGAGKIVTGSCIPDSPCISSQVKLNFAKNKKGIDEAEVFLVLACGLGVQSALENDRARRQVVAGCNTMFGSILDKTGTVLSEKCSMCGECVLNTTGGICPITCCAKGLLNGPCGGSDKGKCEVDKNKDCAWILIYNRLKEINKLDSLKTVRPPRDHKKLTRPREITLKG
ncbi:MAG: methylenetetrahydrofolate reductase C-terminal domain-containing protein [Candidatus Omnitrophota bacterium]